MSETLAFAHEHGEEDLKTLSEAVLVRSGRIHHELSD